MNKASKEKRQNQLTNILKLEIATAIDRTAKPKSFLREKSFGDRLKPFGDSTQDDLWLPQVYRRPRNKDGSVKEGAPAELVEGTPRTTFFRALELIQARLREACNSAIRTMWLEQEKPLPGLDPSDPKGRKRLPPGPNERVPLGTIAYRVICDKLPGGKDARAVPYVPADMTAALSHRIEQLYSKHVKNTRGRAAVPSIGESWPIWFRPSGWRFSRADGLNLSVNLDGTWWEIGLRIHRKARKGKADPYVMSALSRLAPGEQFRKDNVLDKAEPTASHYIPGTLGIMHSKNKWYVLIQYRQPKPKPLDVQNVTVVHCGLRNFAVCMDLETALGRGGGLWIDGTDITNRKARFRAQRRDIQHASRIAPAGKGHKIKFRSMRLEDHEKRWVESWVRRAACRIVDYAVSRHSNIFMMDLKDIRRRVQDSDLSDYIKPRVHQAPWFKLKTFVEQAAARKGITVSFYDPYYHTKRCPRCGTVDAAAPNYKKWKYICVKCGYVGHLDRVGIENAFLDLGLAKQIDFPDDSVYAKAAQEIRDTAYLTGLDKSKGAKGRDRVPTGRNGIPTSKSGAPTGKVKVARKARAKVEQSEPV